MKKIIFLSVLIFCSTNLIAQLSLAKSNTEYEKTNRPCIEVKLTPATDEVKKAWKDFVKDNYNVKMRGIGFLANKDVMYAEEVTLENISPKSINFYTRVVEDDDLTKMCVFASLGYDIHISAMEYPKEWEAMKNMTYKFLNNYLPNHYQNIIEETKDQISDLNDDKKDMEDELSDNEKEIKKLLKRNEELKGNIIEITEKLENTNNILTNEKKSLKDVKNKLKKLDFAK